MWFEKEIINMAEFEKAIEPLSISNPIKPSICFRGQSNSEWKLNPSFLRQMLANIDLQTASLIELASIKNFQKKARLVLNPLFLPEPDSVLGWLSLMQHHNAPTRLLDWSHSPYVALYFAVQENPDKDGALWYFDSAVLEHSNTQEYRKEYAWINSDWMMNNPFPKKVEWRALQATHKNMLFELSSDRAPETTFYGSDRQAAQQGTFTVSHTVTDEHSFVIAKAMDFTHSQRPTYYTEQTKSNNYCKLIVKSSSKGFFLRKLNEMNINASSLFPGIDGLGRSIASSIGIHIEWLRAGGRSGEEVAAMYGLGFIDMHSDGRHYTVKH